MGMNYHIENADCLEWLKTLDANSVESIVTDPPSGISFCGNEWDSDKGGADAWIDWLTAIMAEALRVLRPGGYGLVWALPRTSHWTGTALEQAGFEVRDCVAHLFGQGFPKSMDVSKAIDKELGAERSKVRYAARNTGGTFSGAEDSRPWVDESVAKGYHEAAGNEPATPEAATWQGWGTALKPACEFWWLVRKPLAEKNVARNVLEHGTGGINIDGCRIPATSADVAAAAVPNRAGLSYASGDGVGRASGTHDMTGGRFPANLIVSHSPDCVEVGESTVKGAGRRAEREPIDDKNNYGNGRSSGLGGYGVETVPVFECVDDCPHKELGERSRFFYCPKASKAEKNKGLEELESAFLRTMGDGIGQRPHNESQPGAWVKNNHPTCKPLALMQYLCRMVTPAGGTVLDPFAGSGTTGVAALAEGFGFLGCEQDASFAEIARLRCDKKSKQPLKCD